MSALLTLLALACYVAAVVCDGGVLFVRASAAPALIPKFDPTRFGRPLLLFGIVLQFIAVGVWCVTTHRSPFASEFGTLSISAWAIALALAVLDFRARLPAVAAIALLVACVLLSFALTQTHGPIAETPLLAGQIVSLHVLAILASFGLFAVAFGCAALYLLQNRLLKQPHPSALFRRLPPLATLDSVAYHAVAYALPLLTIGLALGMARIFRGGLTTPTAAWFTDAHTIASFGTWLLYLCYLSLRLLAGWRGVRLQYVLLLGMVVALALYVVPTSTHRFT